MIKHLFKYLLIVLLAGGFTACSRACAPRP